MSGSKSSFIWHMAMLKTFEMLTRPAELTPRRTLNLQGRNAELSKKCGAEGGGGCAAGTTSSVARRWPISSQQLECDWLAPYRE